MIRRLLSPLGARLALAFLAVAAIAVAILAGMTFASAQSQVSALVSSQQRSQTNDIAAALAEAYSAAGGWSGANLSGAYALAASGSAHMNVLDAHGAEVSLDSGAMSGLMQQMHGGGGTTHGMMSPSGTGTTSPGGPTLTAPVVAGGATVGTVQVTFPATTPAAAQAVRDALGRTVILGSVLAGVAALVVALFVSHRVTRPLLALTAAAQRLRGGDRGARVDVRGPGELGALAGTFNTMASTLEKEEQVRRALVADVAHELRTPMTILLGESEALLDGAVAVTPARLSSLHDEVLRLGRLVEDLETLNAAHTAGLDLQRRTLDLASVAGGAAASLQGRFADARVELTTELGSSSVEGDPTRLHQVVVNLLTNALKYTPAGGHAWLRVTERDGFGVVEVRDDGPGIPAGELPHVFDRFWRGSAAASTAADGRGIGLAVVEELVSAHGGRVEVSSTVGEGSTFRVLLPRR